MSDVCSLLYKSKCATRVAICLLFVTIVSVNPLSAQQAPSPWVARDVGSPAVTGSTTYDQGQFTVNAGGADIWGTADQFHFVYQQIAGDVEILARVDGVTMADAWSKAGVMIRGSLTAGSAHAFALVSAGKGIAFQRRTQNDGLSASTAGPAATAPGWVRLVRSGTKVTASTSPDGSAWATIGSATIALGSVAYVGLAGSSHNTGMLTTAALSRVTVLPLALPAAQTAADIGAPAIPGTVSYRQGTYTVKAAGLDIWNTADQFHFVYERVTGDLDVAVRVNSVTRAHGWSKSGVMIRESLAPGSRHAFAVASAGRGYAFHRRIDTGGYSDASPALAGAPPGWVRLVRSGSRIEAFRSADGVAWTSMGVDAIPMADAVYVGIATTSHNTAATTQAVLDNFRLSAAIARVEFYSNTTLLGTDTTAPYSYPWSSVPAGTYSLTAVAYDNVGARVTSAARSITVNAPTTTAPPTAIVFRASADHATITSYRLDVFASGADPATATPVATSDLAKPAPDAAGDITVNRATFFSALAVGSYQATVTAIGSGGSSRSTPVTFTR